MKNRGPQEITIELPQLKLRGLRWGSVEQPLIIALHGWLDNAASFSLVAPLITDYQVVALDFPGHGHSDDLAHGEEYSFVNFITIFTQAIEQLASEPVIFMGHSLGGAILSFIAAEFPHFAQRLIMIDSLGLLSSECASGDTRLAQWVTNFYRLEGKPFKIYADKKNIITARAQMTELRYEAMLALAERGLIELTEGYRWRVDPRLTLKAFANFSESHAVELLAAIMMPTLEIEASQGVVIDNVLLVERLRVIKHLVLEKLAGPHHIHLAQSEKVADLINQFLVK